MNRLRNEGGEGYESSSKELELVAVFAEIEASGMAIVASKIITRDDWQAIRDRINGSNPKNARDVAAAAARERLSMDDIAELQAFFK